MINRRVVALLALFVPLAACVTGSDSVTSSPNPNAGFQARFVPLGGIMPFPNDLYFNGTKTGTLNIPISDPTNSANAPLMALNHLDGYGTQSDINIYFTAPVKASTLAANVFVFQVTTDPTTKAVTGFTKALVPGVDYSIGLSDGIDAGGTIVTIKPLKPLTASTVTFSGSKAVPVPGSYLVVVTSGVTDASGNPASPSSDFAAILAADAPALAAGVDVTKIAMDANDPLLPVAQFTLGQLAVAAAAQIDPSKIAVTFSFSTQYLGLSLAELAANAKATAQPAGVGIVDTGLTAFDALTAAGESLSGTAAAIAKMSEVYAGTVALPYYLPVPTTDKPDAALTGSWHNAAGGDTTVLSPIPKATKAQNVIPILVSIPNGNSPCGAMPAAGWPVVIFQHGITRSREDMLAVAGTLASQCFAVVAIDLPLHGVTNTKDPLYLKGFERTFDMDLENNDTLAAGSDGTIDSSGAWFINLNSTLTSRDNLREGAADLVNLAVTLPTLFAVDSPTAPTVVNTFDGSRIFFVGHSLGGIVGTTFLGTDTAAAALTGTSPKVVAAVLGMPGGHVAELLRNSPTFGPIIDAGLASAGIVKDTQSYFDFYSEAQAVVEDGDPANYAFNATAGHPIHMLEVVGDGTAKNPPDQVVPNSATDLLASLMGLTSVDTAGLHPVAAGAGTLAQFTAGDHGSILDPTANAAVTTEMQSEMASLFATAGTAVLVTDTTHLK